MFMGLGLKLGVLGAVVVAIFFGLQWLRKDAQADIIRDQLIKQTEKDLVNVRERKERIDDIADDTNAELLERACRGGMLPADSCN